MTVVLLCSQIRPRLKLSGEQLDDETSRPEEDLTTQITSTGTSQPSHDPTLRFDHNTRRWTGNLDVLFDGHNVTGLVNTGADCSVGSGPSARKMKKVKTPRDCNNAGCSLQHR